MTSSWLLLADIHLHIERLHKQNKTIEWIKDITYRETPSHVFILGDSFHSRTKICIETQQVFRDFLHFFQQCDWKPSLHVLVGNHDMVYLHDRTVNAPSLFEDKDKKTFVYSELTTCYIDGMKVLFVPYHENQKTIGNMLNFFDDTDARELVVFAHIAVDGTKVNGISDNSNSICRNKHLALPSLSRFKRVFAGHFHHHETYGNFMYVGSPMMYSFADVNQPERGCITYLPHTNMWKLHINPHAVQFLVIPHDKTNTMNEADITGKQIRITSQEILHDDAKVQLDKKFIDLGATNVEFKALSAITENLPTNRLGETNTSFTQIIQEFVRCHPFDSEEKESLINHCLQWCNGFETRIATVRFQGNISKVETFNFLGARGKRTFDYQVLTPGTWYLQGNNGYGKSLMCEAISFAIFGVLYRGNLPVKDIIHKDAGKRETISVSVCFENGYAVTRKRTKDKVTLEVRTPTGIVEKGAVKETQKYLNELMNIDVDTFERITMLVGRNMEDQFTGKEKDRRILEKLFRLDIDDLYKNATDQSTKIGNEITSIKSNLDKEKSELSTIETIKMNDWNDAQTENAKEKSYNEEISKGQSICATIKERLETLYKQEDTLNSKSSELELEINQLSETLDMLHTTHRALSEELAVKDQENIQQHRHMEWLNSDITDLKTATTTCRKEISKNESSRNVSKQTLLEEERKYQNMQHDMQQLSSRASLVETKLNSESDKLDHLLSEIEEDNKVVDYLRKVAFSEEEHINTTTTLSYNMGEAEQMHQEIECLEQTIKNMDEQTTKSYIETLQRELDSVQNELQDLRSNKDAATSTYQEDFQQYQKELDTCQIQLETYRNQEEAAQRSIRHSRESLNNHLKLHEDTEKLLHQINEAKNKLELAIIKESAHDIAQNIHDTVIATRIIHEIEVPLNDYMEKHKVTNDDITKLEMMLSEKVNALRIHPDITKEHIQQRLKMLSEEQSEEQRHAISLQHSIKVTNKRCDLLHSQLTEIQNLYTESLRRLHEEQEKLMNQRSTLDRKLKTQNDNMSLIKKAREDLLIIKTKHTKILQRLEELSRKKENCERSIKSLEAQKPLKLLQKDLPTTRDEHERSIQEKRKRLESSKETKKKLQEVLEIIKDEIAALYTQKNKSEETQKDLRIKIQECEKNIACAETKLDLYEKDLLGKQDKLSTIRIPHDNRELLNELKQREQQTTDTQGKRSALQKKKSLHKQVLDNIGKSIKETDVHLQSEIKKNEGYVALANDSKQRRNVLLQKYHSRHEDSQKRHEKIRPLEQKLSDLQTTLSLNSFWEKATSPTRGRDGKGGTFRQFCLQRAVRLINARLEQTLETLNEGHSSNLKCRLNDSLVLESCNGSVTFLQRSSGEQKISKLAVIFTIMELIMENCGFETNILFLDEILNALDHNAIYMVEKWISNFTKKKPHLRTFLITHTEIAAAGKSEGTIRAEKKRVIGCSYKTTSHSRGQIPFVTSSLS